MIGRATRMSVCAQKKKDNIGEQAVGWVTYPNRVQANRAVLRRRARARIRRAGHGPQTLMGGHTGALVSRRRRKMGGGGGTHLNVLSLFCQPRLSSTLILTQRKIISSPPLKSMPSWTMSPSLMGNALLS